MFVARYTYDEWGNITSITDGNGVDVSANASHIANINPLRYRSYFYDAETGWYWLNTRYYNPEVGRFLNADGYVSTGQGIIGHNMFAYCNNNPVNYADPSGSVPVLVILLGVVLIGGCFSLTGCQNTYIDEDYIAEMDNKIYQGADSFDSMDDAAIAMADDIYYNHKSELISVEFAGPILYDITNGVYRKGAVFAYTDNMSFAGDINNSEHVASFHTHPVQLSTGFSGEDIQKTHAYLIATNSKHVEYLLHKDNVTNLYTLVRYDATMPLGSKPIVVKEYYE